MIFYLFLALLSSTAFGQDHDSIGTRFGTLTTSKSDGGSTDTILLDGKQVLQRLDEYVSLGDKFELGDEDVVLVGVNAGGSGTPESELRFLVLTKGAPTKIVGDGQAQLVAVWQDVQAKASGDQLVVDLGIQEKKHKIATFDARKNAVRVGVDSKPPASKAALSGDDCKWLFEEMLKGCAAVPTPCKDPTQALLDSASMAVKRGYLAMTDQPRFRPRSFIKACEAACKARKVPDFVQFQSSVCK